MYLLDSNVFIEAHRRYYGISFAPGFWDWLQRSFATGLLASIEPIKKELEQGAEKDDLVTWVKANKRMFLPVDSSVRASFQLLSNWVMNPQHKYNSAAQYTFMASGDYLLIAYAHAHCCTVVTHERSVPDSKKNIKIPDACNAFGIKWLDPFTILRNSNVKFILSTEP
jgi:hypothetical protein